jgi:addiction module HigA family antidote
MVIKKDFRIAAHPGEVLQMMLDESNITQTELARKLKEKHSKINEICRGKRGISAEMAVKLGLVLRQSPDLWMGLQSEWELSQIDQRDIGHIEPIKLRA